MRKEYINDNTNKKTEKEIELMELHTISDQLKYRFEGTVSPDPFLYVDEIRDALEKKLDGHLKMKTERSGIYPGFLEVYFDTDSGDHYTLAQVVGHKELRRSGDFTVDNGNLYFVCSISDPYELEKAS